MKEEKRYITAWAIQQKKDNFEYKVGDVVEISLWRRSLVRWKTKYQKIIEIKFEMKC